MFQRVHGCSVEEYGSRLPKTDTEGAKRENTRIDGKKVPWARDPGEAPQVFASEPIRENRSAEVRIETQGLVLRGVPQSLAADVIEMTIARTHNYTSHVITAKDWVQKKPKDRPFRHLVLSGPKGVGKSFAAVCLMRTVPRIVAGCDNSNARTARFVRATDLFETLKGKLDDARTAKIQSLKECNLLIIDNLGGESMNEETFSRFFDLIDARHESANNIRTIYTTEFSKSDFEARYKSAITDRVYSCGMCEHSTADSLR